MEDVVKCTVYLTDPNDFPAMNEVYKEFLPTTARARTTIQAGAIVNGMTASAAQFEGK